MSTLPTFAKFGEVMPLSYSLKRTLWAKTFLDKYGILDFNVTNDIFSMYVIININGYVNQYTIKFFIHHR